MKTQLYFKEVNVYGQTLYKPVDGTAHQLTMLTGNKTLNIRQLHTLEGIGFTITMVNEFNSINLMEAK